jgi:hypothetical protein
MTMNPIKLEKRFHNGTVLYIRRFGVFINGFNDGQQDFSFFVNAADGQSDCITTDTNGEDYSGCHMEKQSNHHLDGGRNENTLCCSALF